MTNLSTSNEDKTLIVGQNSLLLPVVELVAEPQPVWQSSITAENGEIKEHYVQFVDNLESSLSPAMSSVGSYGHNLCVVKRGSASKYPLFVMYEGYGAKADKSVGLEEELFNDCYILQVWDWLPIPTDDGSIGDNTFFSGMHSKYNYYTDQNPIPTSGIIKLYTQRRIMESVYWVEDQYPIDKTKVYLKGTSSSGYGALLTAMMYSEKIAAVYCVVEPNALSAATDAYKQMWGEASSQLKSDVVDWKTGDTLLFKDLTDIQKVLDNNEQRSLPLIFDVKGKNDVSVIWNEGKIRWMDSLESNRVGGAWYWDQRDHGGAGKNFENEETEPDYYRFATNKAYPAFSHCNIDQNPGNGTPGNGDDYGSHNGYLDWRDSTDKECKYWVNVFVKDFYVSGVLDPEQYSTCTADITFRRLQKFKPTVGQKVQWKNFDHNGVKIQNGSFNYSGGLITIKNVTINKSGNLIKLKIENCSAKIGEEDDDEIYTDSDPVSFIKTPSGYTAEVNSSHDQETTLRIYDLAGRLVREQSVQLAAGINEIEIASPGDGIYIVRLKGESFNRTEKLFF